MNKHETAIRIEVKVTYADNGVSVIEYDDGSIETAQSDGSGVLVTSDKTVTSWDTNGNIISWDSGSGLQRDIEVDFPIKTKTACQLKWSHSTVFLPTATTSSCHRVDQKPIQKNFDFHIVPEKILAREDMLNGEWPMNGCEYCKKVEDVGGVSDRMAHLKYPGLSAPYDLTDKLTETHVTPRWLEIYFSNVCNLGCLYCNEGFSSVWESENIKFLPNHKPNPMIKELEYTDSMFAWLEGNIGHLYNLIILGGEPFLQPQSDRLLDFLSNVKCPELTLTFFSNLSMSTKRLKKRFDKMQKLVDNGNINSVHVVGSVDCWGPESEFVRSGLDLKLFEANFRYLLYNTTCKLNINMTATSLSVFTMPALIKKINEWNEVRRVYVSMMMVNGSGSFAVNEGGDLLSMAIFGKDILNWGLNESIKLLNTHGDAELIKFKTHLNGLASVIETYKEDIDSQKKLHKFLTTIDSRRGTCYETVFPFLSNIINNNIKNSS